jgi:hypothetical protein
LEDRNCLTYWHPKLVAAGLPTPRTEIVDAGEGWRELANVLDNPPCQPFLPLIQDIWAAAERLGGYPLFLRTGQGSGKHQWRDTCYLASENDVSRHVVALIEWSECVDMMGLPYRYWCVREMLPTMPVGVCERHGGMPVNREFRVFVDGGRACCCHPYWPRAALEQGGCKLSDADYDHLYNPVAATIATPLAALAGSVLGGRWSVDLLETRNGWFICDCAEAARSFHWPGCEAK